MNTKHTRQKCSMCSVEFKTSIDLLSHVAREHHDEEEVRLQSTPKSDSKQEKPDFVFSGRTSDDELARSSQWVATYTRGRFTCTYHIIFEIYIKEKIAARKNNKKKLYSTGKHKIKV